MNQYRMAFVGVSMLAAMMCFTAGRADAQVPCEHICDYPQVCGVAASCNGAGPCDAIPCDWFTDPSGCYRPHEACGCQCYNTGGRTCSDLKVAHGGIWNIDSPASSAWNCWDRITISCYVTTKCKKAQLGCIEGQVCRFDLGGTWTEVFVASRYANSGIPCDCTGY